MSIRRTRRKLPLRKIVDADFVNSADPARVFDDFLLPSLHDRAILSELWNTTDQEYNRSRLNKVTLGDIKHNKKQHKLDLEQRPKTYKERLKENNVTADIMLDLSKHSILPVSLIKDMKKITDSSCDEEEDNYRDYVEINTNQETNVTPAMEMTVGGNGSLDISSNASEPAAGESTLGDEKITNNEWVKETMKEINTLSVEEKQDVNNNTNTDRMQQAIVIIENLAADIHNQYNTKKHSEPTTLPELTSAQAKSFGINDTSSTTVETNTNNERNKSIDKSSTEEEPAGKKDVSDAAIPLKTGSMDPEMIKMPTVTIETPPSSTLDEADSDEEIFMLLSDSDGNDSQEQTYKNIFDMFALIPKKKSPVIPDEIVVGSETKELRQKMLKVQIFKAREALKWHENKQEIKINMSIGQKRKRRLLDKLEQPYIVKKRIKSVWLIE